MVRILLADDHAVVRAGIRNALEGLPGLQVIGEVGDGLALDRALVQLHPDCVLIDITMPDFEPISAIRRFRATFPRLKILVVSAYDDDVYVQGLIGAGVDGYHLKDQPLSDLRLAVQRVLAGERWVTGRLLEKLWSGGNAGTSLLTPRQCDILQLLRRGYDNQRIALEIGISIKTVENHLTRLYRQLKVQSRLEAVNYVQTHPGILENSTAHFDAPLRAPQPHPSRPSILLVDDNQRYRKQLHRMISRLHPPTAIFEAGNTDEALDLCQQINPKLIFIDVVLQNEDGIRCAILVKKESPNARVVLISAYPDREFHWRGLQAGAVAFLDKKDLDSAALQQIMADILGDGQ